MFYYKKHFSVTRSELYERIWTQPVVQVAKEYGLSDVGLRKKCKKFKIPLPPLGYWAKKQFGKPIQERPPLPFYDGDDEIKFEIEDKKEKAPEILELEDPLVIEGQKKIAFEELEENKIKVPESLISPHPFVIQTQQILNDIKTPDHRERCLDIDVGRNSINRALRLMDALIKALESRGFKVSLSKDTYNEYAYCKTCIQVLGRSFEIRLREHTTRKLKVFTKEELKERSKYRWLYDRVEYVWEHNGKFTLEIKSRMPYGLRENWSDAERTKVENKLNNFISELIKAVIQRRSNEIKEKRKEQERLERERQRAEKERLRKEEEARIEELYNEVTDWHMAEYIRTYIKAVKDKHGELTPGSELEKWTTWASKQADRLDSLAKRLSKNADTKE